MWLFVLDKIFVYWIHYSVLNQRRGTTKKKRRMKVGRAKWTMRRRRSNEPIGGTQHQEHENNAKRSLKKWSNEELSKAIRWRALGRILFWKKCKDVCISSVPSPPCDSWDEGTLDGIDAFNIRHWGIIIIVDG